MTIKGREKFLDTWCPAINRARHDYDSPDHLIPEMMTETYFGDFHMRFRPGDLVYVTDAASNRVTLIVDDVDRVKRKVRFSVDTIHTSQPVTADPSSPVKDGLSVRNRGPRGGLWSIVDAQGAIIKTGMSTRDDALRELDVLRKMRDAA